MPDLLIHDVEEPLLLRLRERASAHGATIEAEAHSILAAALAAGKDDPWAVIDVVRERLARSGRVFEDSTPSIREDRDR